MRPHIERFTFVGEWTEAMTIMKKNELSGNKILLLSNYCAFYSPLLVVSHVHHSHSLFVCLLHNVQIFISDFEGALKVLTYI